MAGQLILSLAILVTFHEAGHFLAARAFGIRVEKFYLFFDAWGKKLFSFKKGDTEYGIGWLPLGGYVKIAGMIDESLDKEQMTTEPEPWEFRAKPAWQRFIVMIGGIVVNLILGFVIFTFYTYHYKQTYLPVTALNQTGIYAGDAGEKYGFRNGDKLLSLDGHKYERYADYLSYETFMGGTVEVEGTDGQKREIKIPGSFLTEMKTGNAVLFEPPMEIFVNRVEDTSGAAKAGIEKGDRIYALNDTAVETFTRFGKQLSHYKGKSAVVTVIREKDTMNLVANIDTAGKLGFYPDLKILEDQRVPYTLGMAAKYATKDAWDNIYYNIVGFGKIFKGEIKARDSISSVVGIAGMYGGVWDWGRFWRITAILSLILAFMNALPIPALDGGHMMFLTWEMITGKPPAERVLLIAQYIGMILLIGLMLLAVANDIFKAFGI